LRTATAIPHNLPAQVTTFIGREDETVAITRLLASGQRIVSLVGAGGCGKTRLALRVANEVRADFGDGAWFVELADVAGDDNVVRAVADALGVREFRDQPLPGTIVERLGSARMLLLLDNCEHVVLGAARLVEAVTRACPAVHVLATTRELLGVPGETAFPVSSLSLPGDVPAEIDITDSITESEAVRLFVDRARSANPRFTISNESAVPVAQVCQRLDGIPLAIELAAARTAVLTVAQINERLDDRFHLLTAGSRTALPRQQTLRALVDWSYDLLEERERVLLSRLSIFVGGFTLEAAEAVTAGGAVRASDVLDVLSALVRKSLVFIDDVGGQARYRMLETIRQYGLEKLEKPEERTALRAAHRRWCVELAARADPMHMTNDGPAWHDRLEVELPNLRAAFQSAFDDPEGVEDALRLCSGLGMFLWMRGHITEGRTWAETALARAPEAPDLLRVKAMLVLGELAFAHFDLDVSIPTLEACASLAKSLGKELLAAWALTFAGVSRAMKGDTERGRAQLDAALATAERLANAQERAGLYYYVGSAASLDGDHETARRYLDAAVKLAREIGFPYVLVRFLPVVARNAVASGDESLARLRFAEALELARAAHDRVGVARSLTFLAELSIGHGEFDAARAHLDEAAPIVSREIDDPAATTRVRLALSTLLRLEGSFDAARASLDQGLTAAKRLGREKELCDAHQAIGDLAFDRGENHEANLAYQHSLQLARNAHSNVRIARALRSLGELWIEQGQPERSRPVLEESLALSHGLGTEVQIASSWHSLGLCALGEGDVAGALDLLRQALSTRIQQSHRVEAAATLEALGRAHLHAGEPASAAFAFGAADGLRRALGAPLPPARADAHRSYLTAARSLGDAVFEREWSKGQRAGLTDVLGPLGMAVLAGSGTPERPPS
jgi:predicted ATPase/Tfp pilus assembly protein PilF